MATVYKVFRDENGQFSAKSRMYAVSENGRPIEAMSASSDDSNWGSAAGNKILKMRPVQEEQFKAYDPKTGNIVDVRTGDQNVQFARMRHAMNINPYKALSSGLFTGEIKESDQNDNIVYNLIREIGRTPTEMVATLPQNIGALGSSKINGDKITKNPATGEWESHTKNLLKSSDATKASIDKVFGERRDGVASDFGGAIGSAAAAIGAAWLTGGTAAPSVMFGIDAGGNALNEGLKSGLGMHEASNRAFGVGVSNGVLESFGLGLIWKSAGNTIATRAIKGFFVEGSEEFLQGVSEDLIMRKVRGKSIADILADGLYQGAIGGAVGAGMGTVAAGNIDGIKQGLKERGLSDAQADALINKTIEAASNTQVRNEAIKDAIDEQMAKADFIRENQDQVQPVLQSVINDALDEARHDIDIRDDIKARTQGLDENTQNVVADAVQNFADVISDDFGITQREFLNQTGLQISAENGSKVASTVQFADGTRIDEVGNLVDKNGNVLFQSAMYAAPQKTIQDFYNKVMNSNATPRNKSYFVHTVGEQEVRVPFDTVRHDSHKHNVSAADWQSLLDNLDNVEIAAVSDRPVNKYGRMAALKVRAGDVVWAVGISEHGYITTAFNTNESRTTEKSIDEWAKKNAPQRTADGQSNMLGGSLHDIIGQMQSNVKGKRLYQQNYTADTIDVDGTTRTVFNSNGERIAGTADELRNFWRWFGDSKAVDEDGRPLVVYHGTNSVFDTFSKNEIGRTDEGFYGRGFYFATTKGEAGYYGYYVMPTYLKMGNPLDISKDMGGSLMPTLDGEFLFEKGALLLQKMGMLTDEENARVNEYEKIKKDFLERVKVFQNFDDGAFVAEFTTPDGEHILKRAWESNNTEIGAKNVVFNKYIDDIKVNGVRASHLLDDLSISDYMRSDSANPAKFSEIAKQMGHDGIIAGDEYIVFESSQIKSTDNVGTFDGNTGNIYHQDGDLDVRGYFDHTNMMQQIIGIMKSGDLDTVMHELGHFFSINYINAAIAADKTEKLQPLLEYYKVEHPAALIASTEIQEDLAVKFLSYLKTDQSPRGFRKYFDMVKDWLVKTWDSLKAKGLVQTDELPDEIVRFFDNITIRRPKNLNLQSAMNEKARLKKILHDARVGKLDGVSDADIHTIEELLKTATARIPRMPKSLYNKLWGQLNIKFAETHDLLPLMGIDEKAKYLATSKNGGIKDEQGLLEWLQDEGFIFGDGWSNNASQDMMRWDDALRLIGNAKNTYSIDDAVRVQEIENMRQAQEIARDVLDGQDSYNAMTDIDNAKSAIQRVNDAVDRNKALNKALAADYKKLSAEVRKAKAGTSEMRKAVKTAVSFLYAQDIPTDLKAKFMRSLPMVHDSRSLAKWIAEVRDRAEKEYSDLAFRGQRDRLKHELQETYSPNKRNIKYDYEHNTLFNDLRRYNTLSAEKAQEEIQKFYDGDAEKSGLSREDELRKMMLEYRANLPRRQMSGAFMDELISRIQEAKLIGRDAIDEIQYHRGLERMEARDEILDAIAANKAGKLDKHFAGISDFKSLLNTITNSKIADKFNMVGREINAGIAASARQTESMAEVLRINERPVSDNPRKNAYEFLKYKAELCEPIDELNVSYTDHHGRKVVVGVDNGKKVFSRAHIMDMYNQYKDPKSRELMDKFYGEWQMDHLFSYLTDQDKQTADYLMERLRDIYDMVNPVYVSLYQKDMPRKKIYWPRQSNHEIDHELLERFDGEAREANFTKSRSHGAIPVFNRDVFSNYQAHEKDAQYMVHQAKAFKDAADIFDDSTIKEAIKNKFGKEVAGELSEHLKALSIGGVRKARAQGDTVLNQFFGQIIGSKVNLSPFVMMKQLTSFGAFSANMPLGQYYRDFTHAVVAPRKTYRYMMEHVGEYLRNRYGRGVNETMAAMIDPTRQNFMDRVFGSANRAAFNEFLSRLVRTGDVGAIVYGGYPRLKFLIEEKDSAGNLVRTHDEAVNTFIKESEETQQSATNAAQSNWQRTGKTKVFAMYKTSQIQYFRRVANAYNQMSRGEITRGQFIKTTAIFTAQMAIGYKLMGDLLSAALFGWDDDKDFVDELGELAGAIITQAFDAWGAIGYFVNQGFGVMTGQKRQAELSLVGYSDILQTINNANKIKNGKAGNAYFWVQTIAPLVEGTTGAPVSRYNRVLKKTGTYNALGI